MTHPANASADWPYRHVHLDFHTSELIEGIGSAFDADAFARAFSDAHVQSVNLFAKCHHGWSYHPTDVGEMHPHLDFDLLSAQVEALRGAGIRTPIYVSALWDERIAREEPGWRAVDPDNSRFVQHGDAHETGWKHLDLASPYRAFLLRQIKEVVERFPRADGLWIDICFQRPSISTWAQRGMAEHKLDWRDAHDRDVYSEIVTLEFFRAVRRIADGADMPVFFNLGHVRRGRTEVLREAFSHVEIESLPTAGWGYEHFPVSARYVEGVGLPFLGMTGKFHHLWGEMGGYKRPEALRYECAAMLAQGARVCVGDHLHPTGRADPSTYSAIGEAYAHVVASEPFVEGTRNVAEIAVLSEEAMRAPLFSGMPAQQNVVDDGCVRALLEHRFLFDVVDRDRDFSRYALLILPDAIPVDDDLRIKIESFMEGGGRILVTGAAGLMDDHEPAFLAGAEHEGVSPFERGDYLHPIPDLRAEFVNEPLFGYAPSQRLRVTTGTALGEIHDPYLDRGKGMFSGHLHAPPRPEPNGYALGIEEGGVVRMAHPLFSMYHRSGAVALLEVIGRVLDRALGRPRTLETGLPTAGRATVREGEGRYVVHLLHANPVRRGYLRTDHIEPIQDLVTLQDVAVALRQPRLKSASVRLAPSGETIESAWDGEALRFTLPRLRGHQMIEVRHG